jgi:hypothetical protein
MFEHERREHEDARPGAERADEIEPPPAGGRAQADEQQHERDRRDRDDPVGEQRRGRQPGE